MTRSPALYSNAVTTSQCLTHPKQANIPWHSTQAITNGIAGLNRMYDSLDVSSNLKQFIDAHCKHLLSPMQGDTGIPTSFCNPGVLNALPELVSLGPTFQRSQFWSLSGFTGVYVFLTKDKLIQCGSSIGFMNRIQSHYIDSKNGAFVFGKYLITEYNWVPVKYTPNYVSLFMDTYSEMTSQEKQILTFFTQQEIRTIEQAFSHYCNPENYKGIPVNMWHTNWAVGNDYSNMNTGKQVTWTTAEGKTYTRGSIASAALELGFGNDRVRTVGGVNGATLDTKKYGVVSIDIQGIVKKDSYPDLRSGTPINTYVDTTDLVDNMYYLFDKDMNRINEGPFKTAADVNRALGLPPKYTGIATWCNFMHLISSPKLLQSVYVYKVFVSSDIPMLVTDIDNVGSSPKEYSSVKGMCKDIGITLSALLVRLTNNTSFTNAKTGKTYLFDCVNPADKAKLIARYHSKLAYGKMHRARAKANK